MVWNNVNLISWNVNGINNKVKSYKILMHLKSLGCNIAMIQETHLNEVESLRLKQRWVGQVFFSPGMIRNARGMCILIAKRISFQLNELFTDKKGRFLILSGTLKNVKFVLVNIYAPNTGQVTFLTSLCPLLSKFSDLPMVTGGDFNLVLEPEVDRSNHPLPSDRSLSSAFSEFPSTLGLVDVWCMLNTVSREYTFYSKIHNSHSRIDHFIISNHMLENVINCQIQNIIISDHAPVVLSIVLADRQAIKRTWKFNNFLLRDEEFVSLIKNRISEFITLNEYSVPSIQTVWEAFKVTCRGWIISYSTAKKKQRIEKKHKLQILLKDLECKHMENPKDLKLRIEKRIIFSKENKR
uniref:exodeoxyribonuclease III n=1 Tax=Seriola dumerili TaxID=41447 RepID=A0A3B4V2V9_SERDU